MQLHESERAPPSGASPRAMEVEHLDMVFKSGAADIVALQDINFTVEDGEFIAVVGPSGCGKTTLLKIFAGLIKPSGGVAKLRGTPIQGARPDVGIVFQTPVLYPWRTILENVMIPIDVLRLGRAKYRQSALSLLEMAGLKGFENYYPSQLSGGMQQRVGIVRSLIHEPAMLLMDEPFGALDALTRENMNMELQRIWLENRRTVFFITHSISEAIFLADRVLVMTARPGKIDAILDIDLPRPRSLDMMNSETFGEYARDIRERLNAKGGID
jgi:NitT/TauT family transport system ATP-binding protein